MAILNVTETRARQFARKYDLSADAYIELIAEFEAAMNDGRCEQLHNAMANQAHDIEAQKKAEQLRQDKFLAWQTQGLRDFAWAFLARLEATAPCISFFDWGQAQVGLVRKLFGLSEKP